MITLSLGTCGDGWVARCPRAAAVVIRDGARVVEKARMLGDEPVTVPHGWALAVEAAMRSALALCTPENRPHVVRLRDRSLVHALDNGDDYSGFDNMSWVCATVREIHTEFEWVAKASRDPDMDRAAALAEACARDYFAVRRGGNTP